MADIRESVQAIIASQIDQIAAILREAERRIDPGHGRMVEQCRIEIEADGSGRLVVQFSAIGPETSPEDRMLARIFTHERNVDCYSSSELAQALLTHRMHSTHPELYNVQKS